MDHDPRLLVKDKLGNTPLHYAAEKYPAVLDSILKKAQDLGTSHYPINILMYSNTEACGIQL